MRVTMIAVLLTAVGAAAAQAQAPGSVLCRNGMERADAQVAALDKRAEQASKTGDTAAVCEIWQLAIEVRRQAAETYDRCRSEASHEDRLHEIGTGTDLLRRSVTQYCG